MAPKPSATLPSSWLYDVILNVFSPSIDIFFREVQVRGGWRVPQDGAVILVAAPHANQFVDSLVLMRIMKTLNRRISWLMAEKSFDKPIIGPLATLAGAVPVSRAMDNVKTAQGNIYLLDPDGDPKVLGGVGTKFDGPGFEIGGSIYLPVLNGESQRIDIAEICGPEKIILKTAPTAEEALQQLTRQGGTIFKVAPHVDQTDVYNAVFERLRQDGCVGIFPEGGSHDRTDMLPLKAGIAIMALGSLAQGTQVSIVPVGMNYFHAHKFRSRAVVEFGDPVSIPPEVINNFQNGKRRESVGGLLSSIYQSLAAVTVSAPDFGTMMLVHATRRLYTLKRRHLPLSTVLEMNRRLLKGYTQYRKDPRIEQLSKAITSYTHQMQLLGLRDHQLGYARFSVIGVSASLLYRISKLSILAIGTLPGLLLFSPVFIAARTSSHRKTREALASSTVKVRGNDVMATWKILVAGCLAPLLYTYYAIVLASWMRYNRVHGLVPPAVPLWAIIVGAYIIFPILTYAALILGESGMDILKSLRPLLLCLSPSSVGTLAGLRDQRVELSRQVTELVNTLGPDLYPDCDAERLPHARRLYVDVSPDETLDDLADTEFFSVVE
ncbi:putative acyltransferase [Hyphodiscus hymeniophilus]|uniref:Acyltransferase n=1 Tax=Hyphodiscus hymeniophilus TaxID=353542 RepID=A0A9P7AVZ8_9HELO|nr:putative acyltransferase [Hyphodiscus hymeniophilus]